WLGRSGGAALGLTYLPPPAAKLRAALSGVEALRIHAPAPVVNPLHAVVAQLLDRGGARSKGQCGIVVHRAHPAPGHVQQKGELVVLREAGDVRLIDRHLRHPQRLRGEYARPAEDERAGQVHHIRLELLEQPVDPRQGYADGQGVNRWKVDRGNPKPRERGPGPGSPAPREGASAAGGCHPAGRGAIPIASCPSRRKCSSTRNTELETPFTMGMKLSAMIATLIVLPTAPSMSFLATGPAATDLRSAPSPRRARRAQVSRPRSNRGLAPSHCGARTSGTPPAPAGPPPGRSGTASPGLAGGRPRTRLGNARSSAAPRR